MKEYTKKQFVDAYVYSYGTTKKHAESMYKKVVIEEGNTNFLKLIVEGAKQDACRAFYND